MKKLFLILPFLLLVAAGCDSTSQNRDSYGSKNNRQESGVRSSVEASVNAEINDITNVLDEDLNAEASISSKSDSEVSAPAASVEGLTEVENAQ